MSELLQVTKEAVKRAAESCPQARAVLTAMFPAAVLGSDGIRIWEPGLTPADDPSGKGFAALRHSTETAGAVKVVLVDATGALLENLAVVSLKGIKRCKVTADFADGRDSSGRLRDTTGTGRDN